MSRGVLVGIVGYVFSIYELILLVRVILSWAPEMSRSGFGELIERITEPVMGPCRDILHSLFRFIGIDMRNFQIDFSPILAFFFVDLVRRAAILLLYRLF